MNIDNVLKTHGIGTGVAIDTTKVALRSSGLVNTGLELNQIAFNDEDDGIVVGILNNVTGGQYRVVGYLGTTLNFQTNDIGSSISGLERDKQFFYFSTNGYLYKYKINPTLSPSLIWRTTIVGSASSIAVLPNDNVVMTWNNGALIKVFNSAGTFIKDITLPTTGSKIKADPMDSNFVYVACLNGYVVKINISTGTEVWRVSGIRSVYPMNSFTCTKGFVYLITLDNYGYKFDASTGASIIWNTLLQTNNIITDNFGNIFQSYSNSIYYMGKETIGNYIYIAADFSSNKVLLGKKSGYAVKGNELHNIVVCYSLK